MVASVEALFRDLSVDGWEPSTFYAHAVPEFPEAVPPDEMQEIVGHIRALGRFKELEAQELNIRWRSGRTRATLRAEVEFQRGWCVFDFRLAKVDGEWLVEWISFNP